jgi:ABC-2 type transport system ATP-binding protein
MNGLDPAGMLEFRGLIRDFVAEGRTVVLSSHLLGEVERTCDHVAIVDRGRVVLQGSIDELPQGGRQTVRVATGDDVRVLPMLRADPAVASTGEHPEGIVLTLQPDASANATAAAITRCLVAADIDLYGSSSRPRRFGLLSCSGLERAGEASTS